MGCDIHGYLERNLNNKWQFISFMPFDNYRTYGFYGFLADVRNYSMIEPIKSNKGFPNDCCGIINDAYKYWEDDMHNVGWIYIEDLINFDYTKIIEDRRIHGQTCAIGEGKKMQLSEFLGASYFEILNKLKNYIDEKAPVRLVFWFDN